MARARLCRQRGLVAAQSAGRPSLVLHADGRRRRHAPDRVRRFQRRVRCRLSASAWRGQQGRQRARPLQGLVGVLTMKMKRPHPPLSKLMLGLAVLVLLTVSGSAKAWWDGNWSYRKQITVDAGPK